MIAAVASSVQAAFGSCISLVGIAVEMQLNPYRRPSDNRIAVFSRWIVFLWAFGLLLRLDGILGSMPSVLVGLILVLATLAVVEEALRLSIVEMRQDLKTRRQESAADDDEADTMPQVTEESRCDDESKISEREAGLAQPQASMVELRAEQGSPEVGGQERAAIIAGSTSTATGDSASVWARMFGPSLLCMAQSQELGGAAVVRRDDLAAVLAEKESELLALEKSLAEHAEALVAKDGVIAEKENEISRLRGGGGAH